MSHSTKSLTVATGFAMFSMFFGAGNVVFPLSLGQLAQDQAPVATIGLLLTAILIPFTGLLAMMLFQGDYDAFFDRLGKTPGRIVIFATVLLIGPAAAMPRCITLSHATIKLYLTQVNLPIFSAVACLIIYLLTYRKRKIVDILGYVLTPILLLSLGTIIVVGFLGHPNVEVSNLDSLDLFKLGLMEGYNTMDLMGAFFFSHVVLLCLKKELPKEIANDPRKLLTTALRSSFIGAGLLALVYGGFATVASFYSVALIGVPQDQLMGALAVEVLGSSAGIIACLAVALACLTTAIALATVFAEYLQIEVSNRKLSYPVCLIITLGMTFLISTLEFDGIARFLVPILQASYPALIVLSVLNLGHKLWGWDIVKGPVAATLTATVVWQYLL